MCVWVGGWEGGGLIFICVCGLIFVQSLLEMNKSFDKDIWK